VASVAAVACGTLTRELSFARKAPFASHMRLEGQMVPSVVPERTMEGAAPLSGTVGLSNRPVGGTPIRNRRQGRSRLDRLSDVQPALAEQSALPRVEPAVARRPPPQTRTSAINASGSSANKGHAIARSKWLTNDRSKYFNADAKPRHRLPKESLTVQTLASRKIMKVTV